jgi:hypothetical protein
MANNIPKYIMTLCDSRFKNINKNIILIEKNNGKILNIFNDKQELFNILKINKYIYPIICCYKDVTFTYDEIKILRLNNILVLSQNEIDDLSSPYISSSSFFNY